MPMRNDRRESLCLGRYQRFVKVQSEDSRCKNCMSVGSRTLKVMRSKDNLIELPIIIHISTS